MDAARKYLKVIGANLMVALIGGLVFSILYVIFSLIVHHHVKWR